MIETRHAVRLSGVEVGVLHQRGDYVRFVFLPEYWENPDRPILGLWFEDNRDALSSALKLPHWFSNLLPEGRLRQLIATDRGVSAEREMELLAHVGSDLPGAVEVVDGKGADVPWIAEPSAGDFAGVVTPTEAIKFSLAGIGMKFSMIRHGDRFSIPGGTVDGDEWIVKLPDPNHRSLPQNEYSMMSLAAKVGIEVPEIRLVHRDNAFGVPTSLWPHGEEFAYAIRRFDRSRGGRTHIEDLAQVRGFSAGDKYRGSFETVAALCYRGGDMRSLQEFVRRVVFNIAIGNGDAHLKNWSMIYLDQRLPTLSPAYDIVSTIEYEPQDDLALSLGGTKSFGVDLVRALSRIETRLGVPAGELLEVARSSIQLLSSSWNPDEVSRNLVVTPRWLESSIRRLGSALN